MQESPLTNGDISSPWGNQELWLESVFHSPVTKRQKLFTAPDFCLSSPGQKELQDEVWFFCIYVLFEFTEQPLFSALISTITENDTVSRWICEAEKNAM